MWVLIHPRALAGLYSLVKIIKINFRQAPKLQKLLNFQNGGLIAPIKSQQPINLGFVPNFRQRQKQAVFSELAL